jgi:hypothetical protein
MRHLKLTLCMPLSRNVRTGCMRIKMQSIFLSTISSALSILAASKTRLYYLHIITERLMMAFIYGKTTNSASFHQKLISGTTSEFATSKHGELSWLSRCSNPMRPSGLLILHAKNCLRIVMVSLKSQELCDFWVVKNPMRKKMRLKHLGCLNFGEK